jgi:DNA-binding MarR family transcriptional regulator
MKKIVFEENKEKISYMLLGLVYRLIEVDKKIRCYGTDKQLTESEIHMIKAVRENPGLHVTRLAERLNVTKGAVSQVVIKLEQKGVIVKERDVRNLSRLQLRLTQKGETAYKYHEILHEKFDASVEKILKDATPKNKDFIRVFVKSLMREIEEFETQTER